MYNYKKLYIRLVSMENFKLQYYEYSKELRRFSVLDTNGSYVGIIRDLTTIIEYLADNLIQYEVDEKFNILLLSYDNNIDIASSIKQKFN